MLTIHNFPSGGRGQRIAWLCEELDLAYRMAAVGFPPSADYLALNPLGTVPYLQDDEAGVAISESAAICLYLAERNGPTPWLPSVGHPDRAAALEWLVFSEATLGAHLNSLLADRYGAPEADRGGWLVRMAQDRLAQAVELIAARLGDRDYLVGEAPTVADIAIASGLNIWRRGLGGAAPDSLGAWLRRLEARPAYQRARAAAG